MVRGWGAGEGWDGKGLNVFIKGKRPYNEEARSQKKTKEILVTEAEVEMTLWRWKKWP